MEAEAPGGFWEAAGVVFSLPAGARQPACNDTVLDFPGYAGCRFYFFPRSWFGIPGLFIGGGSINAFPGIIPGPAFEIFVVRIDGFLQGTAGGEEKKEQKGTVTY